MEKRDMVIEIVREKRKKALIIVCSLGFAAVFNRRTRPYWLSKMLDTFDSGSVIGFILKGLFFIALAIATAAIFFVINIFKLIHHAIYYQILIKKQNEQNEQ